MLKTHLTYLVCVVFVASLVAVMTSPPVTVASQSYQVRPGDSLWRIAQQHNLSVSTLQNINHLTSTTIYPGQHLYLSKTNDTYVVKPGDSLWNISQRYGVSVGDIQRANNLGTNTILLVGQRLQMPNTTSPSTVPHYVSTEELNLLARTVFSEARGEPYVGQVAVAAVVLNRVADSRFPNTIWGVVYEPWQFEPVVNGDIYLQPNAEAYRAAQDALNGYDPTYGAVFFYNPSKVEHSWLGARPVITRIGGHVFLR